MNDQEVEDPEQTLTEVRRLRTRSRRRAHGGAWLPAVVLAVLVLLSVALYRYPLSSPQAFEVSYPFWAGLPDEQRSAGVSYAFWLLGLPATFLVIAAWYRYRARKLGVRVPWPTLVSVGMGALVLLLALVAVPRRPAVNPDALTAADPPLWHGLATPLLAVAIAVAVLGGLERHPGLVATGAWMGLLTWWQCATGRLGALPGWLTRLLGGSGSGLGGQLTVRPAVMLLVLVGPLLSWVAFAAVRARGGTR